MLDRTLRAPLDLDRAFADPEWRRCLAWPITSAACRKISKRPMAGLAGLVSRSAAEDRAVLLLGASFVAAFARQILDVAATLEAAKRGGMPVAAQSQIALALGRDSSVREALIAALCRGSVAEVPSRALMRRFGRIASWSPVLRQLKSLVRPDVLAISHNSLLVAGAACSRAAVGFEHADGILARARLKHSAPPPDDGALASAVVDAVTSETGLADTSLAGVRDILVPVARHWMAVAGRDLSVLGGLTFPVEAIWSATGGSYASRAVGLAAMKQGLAVRRYEHVGTGCMIDDGLGFDFTERAVSSEVAVPTPELARFAENIRTESLEPLGRLIAGAGDPAFRFTARPRQRSARPRVVYATTILRGPMQYHGALLPDAVYLDWQMRVAEALAAMPIAATIKPHPESKYPDGRNPLTAMAPVSNESFEKLIPETDVFVFDFGQTTTFWKGLSTAQPVVYLDLGLTDFQPEVKAALAKRATIVPVAYDERNRPLLDTRAVAEAIASAKPAGAGNPFARWLGGSAAA